MNLLRSWVCVWSRTQRDGSLNPLEYELEAERERGGIGPLCMGERGLSSARGTALVPSQLCQDA